MATKKVVTKEATKEAVVVSFKGLELTVLADRDAIPFAALEAFEDGKPIAFLRAMLGTKEYARLKTVVTTVSDFNDFMDAVLAAVGIDPKDLED